MLPPHHHSPSHSQTAASELQITCSFSNSTGTACSSVIQHVVLVISCSFSNSRGAACSSVIQHAALVITCSFSNSTGGCIQLSGSACCASDHLRGCMLCRGCKQLSGSACLASDQLQGRMQLCHSECCASDQGLHAVQLFNMLR